MNTFGLQDLMTILGGTVALGLVSAFGPALWRAFKAAIGPANPRRPMYHIVKGSQDAPAVVMSRSESAPAVEPLSSKDAQRPGRTDSALLTRAQLLILYKLLRKYGIPREEARPVLKTVWIPLSNDVWAEAAPPQPAADQGAVHLTPIVGRATSAKFETDPDYPFEPCSA